MCVDCREFMDSSVVSDKTLYLSSQEESIFIVYRNVMLLKTYGEVIHHRVEQNNHVRNRARVTRVFPVVIDY